MCLAAKKNKLLITPKKKAITEKFVTKLNKIIRATNKGPNKANV